MSDIETDKQNLLITEAKNNKDRIIEVASKLFRQKGYGIVTMRDIAKELNIKASSLYNHITCKQEILSEIIMPLAWEFTEGMNDIVRTKEDSITKLKKIISLHIDISIKYPNPMSSINNDWMHLEEKKKEFYRLRVTYESNFKDIIEEGIKNKEIADINVDVILYSILSTLRTLYLWIPKKKERLDYDLTEKLTQVLLTGIVL